MICEKELSVSPITEEHCISMQKILAQDFNKIQNINRRKQYEVCAEDCLNCKTGLKFYQESLTEKKGEVIMATKICGKCKKEFPATKEYFYGQKSSKDGLHPWCKDCHNISSGNVPQKKSPKEPDQKPLNEKRHEELCALEKKKEPENPVENVIELDFSKYPELFKTIKDWAEGELRTIENQVLFYLLSQDKSYSLK